MTLKKALAGSCALALLLTPLGALAQTNVPTQTVPNFKNQSGVVQPAIGTSILAPDGTICDFRSGGNCNPGGGGGGGSGGGGGGSGLPFTPSSTTNTVPLAVNGTSANVAVPTGVNIVVANPGSGGAWLALGTSSSVTAAVNTGTYLGPGQSVPLVVGANTYLAGITAGTAVTLQVTGGSLTLPVSAAGPYVYTSLGFQQVSVGTSAVSFTPAAGATICFIQSETAPVRYRTDSTAPTASIGSYLPVTGSTSDFVLPLTANLTGAKFISANGTTATLDVDCDR
jgi:hypothetical protein